MCKVDLKLNMDRERILNSFGNKIRSLRQEAQLSQEELADICDLHRTYIGSVERGERNVTLITLFVLASALKVEPHTLIDFHNEDIRQEK